MSVIADILTLAGVQPSSVSTGESADAAGFAGLMADAQGGRPRGMLGLGRRLAEQVQAETARLDEAGPLTGGEAMVLQSLLTVVQPKAEEPLTSPDLTTDAGSAGPVTTSGQLGLGPDSPQINPGPQSPKTDAPQINPGPLTAKPETPPVMPTEPVAKDGAQVLPEATEPTIAPEVLTALAEAGEPVRAEATAAAVRQVVGRAPEAAAPQEPVVEPLLPSSDDVALDSVETPDLTLTPTTSATAATSGSATASTGVAGAAQAEASAPAAATDHAEPAVDTAADAGPALLETEAAAAAPTTEAPTAAPIRADAVPMHRGAADAIAQVSAQIIRRLEGRATRFNMELNPAELGKVDVRLDIDAEGRLAARLAFDNPAAAVELRGRVDELRRDLEQAGFQLSEDAFSFTDREGSRERREAMADGILRSFARSAEASELADLAAQPALRVMTRLGLDVRV